MDSSVRFNSASPATKWKHKHSTYIYSTVVMSKYPSLFPYSYLQIVSRKPTLENGFPICQEPLNPVFSAEEPSIENKDLLYTILRF